MKESQDPKRRVGQSQGEGVVGPVPVPGGGGRVREAGGGVYSARAATGETRDPSKCSCQSGGKDDNGSTTQSAKDGDNATSNSTWIL